MNSKFCSLEEYYKIATRMLYYYAPKLYGGLSRRILNSEDALADVVHNLIKADWQHDEKKGPLDKHRTRMAIYAIKSYVRQNFSSKRNLTISMEEEIYEDIPIFLLLETNEQDPKEIYYEEEEKKEIRRLLTKAPISDKKRSCIVLYYFDGMTMQEIGDKYGVTKQRVSQILHEALEDLRRYYANKI